MCISLVANAGEHLWVPVCQLGAFFGAVSLHGSLVCFGSILKLDCLEFSFTVEY